MEIAIYIFSLIATTYFEVIVHRYNEKRRPVYTKYKYVVFLSSVLTMINVAAFLTAVVNGGGYFLVASAILVLISIGRCIFNTLKIDKAIKF